MAKDRPNHPGWIPPSERCQTAQPRIDTAEKQRNAQQPQQIKPEDAKYHPGGNG